MSSRFLIFSGDQYLIETEHIFAMKHWGGGFIPWGPIDNDPGRFSLKNGDPHLSYFRVEGTGQT